MGKKLAEVVEGADIDRRVELAGRGILCERIPGSSTRILHGPVQGWHLGGIVPVLHKFRAQTLAYVPGIKIREAHTDIDRQFAGYFERILRKPFDRVGLRLVGQTRVGLAVRLEISDKRIGEVPTGV